MARNRRERLFLGFAPASSFAGVVIGHAIAYLLTFPQAVSRRTALAETGHTYWASAVAVAVVCAGVSAVGTLARHLLRGAQRERPIRARVQVRGTAARLAALQSSIFVVQETLERLHSGAPLSGLIHNAFVLVGVVVQIAVAVLLAIALTLLARTAEAVGRALSRSPAPRPTQARRLRPAIVPFRGVLGGRARRSRAPPGSVPLTA